MSNLVITDVRVFDTGSGELTDGPVRIEDGTIVAVGPSAALDELSRERRIP